MTAPPATRMSGPALTGQRPPRRRAPAAVRSLRVRTVPGRIRALAAAAIVISLALGAIMPPRSSSSRYSSASARLAEYR